MTTLCKRRAVAVALTLCISAVHAETPCDGIDRSLTAEQRSTWAPELAKQEKVPKVTVLQSFHLDDWRIIYVDTHQSDETFMFYAQDPLKSHFITEWSGAAMIDEEEDMKSWTLENAPGIPLKLASCFAWHVTKDRDK
jgi:hypothetical protein